MAPARRAHSLHSLSEAANLLGVHRNTLSRWISAEGCPVVTAADRDRGIEWELNLPEVIDWRIKRAVDDAVAKYADDGVTVSIDEAKRRKTVAEAIVAEVDADEALRRVVAITDVTDQVAQEYAAVRSHLQAVGAKVAGRAVTMTSAPEIQDLVDEAIREALEALNHDRGGEPGSPA